MSLPRRTIHVVLLISFLMLTTSSGCHKKTSAAPKGVKPAEVAKYAKEDQLNTVVLTEQAAKRLGITTAKIETRSVHQARTYGGEVSLPTGALILVSAPFAGTLQAAGSEPPPKIGATLKNGQIVFQLMPILSPERAVLTPAERIRYAEAQNTIATARVDAAGLVDQANVQVGAAKIALERAERLLRENAGSAKAVDDARAQLSLAEKALAAAEARKAQVDSIKLDDDRDSGKPSPLPILAPRDGIIRTQHVSIGEHVASGSPLFEVMQCDPLWIKAPVYVGDLDEIDQSSPAKVGSLSGVPGSESADAKPVPAPPTAMALSSTVDLYYQVENAGNRYRPGQRLAVTLTLKGQSEQRGIPWSAVVHDIEGGTWVYEMTGENTFVRRRVEIRQLIGDWATIERGPPSGTQIVVEGVAELFGTEFGFGK